MKKKYWIVGAIVVAALAIALTAAPVFAHGGSTTPGDGEAWGYGEHCDGTGWMGGGHMGMFGGYMLEQAAETLGLTPDELQARLADGETIAEIAEAEGVDITAVTEALMAHHTERVREMVEEGYLSQEDADEMTGHMLDRIDDIIDQEWTGGYGAHMNGSGHMGGFGHGGMMGGFGSSGAFGRMGRGGGMMGGFGRGGMMGSW